MILSLSNWPFFHYPLHESIKKVKDFNLENMEFNMRCVEGKALESLDKVREIVKTYGINCLSVHSIVIHAESEKHVRDVIQGVKLSLDYASKLSSEILVIHSNISRSVEERLRKRILVEVFSYLKDYAESLNVKLALENSAPYSKGYGRTVDEVEEILNIIGEDKIFLTLDYAHSQAVGQTKNFLEKFSQKIVNVHLSMFKHSVIEEENMLELKKFLLQLKKLGYQGPLTIEVNPRYGDEGVRKTVYCVKQLVEEI
ncbi:hypothetical protein DRO51_02745 [Candidatus Bathyarchaeota archaeon]|nr:MAG: hypothetical protein DRO51_02745 [Candidatus Bathyarchaeota archaeon]